MVPATKASETPQHIVLHGVSWDYYERTLQELSRQNVRVAYLDGMMELMSPLPRHDSIKKAVGTLVSFMTYQRGIPTQSYGSTTFRIEDKAAGGEPDDSFYFGEIESVSEMEKFEPGVYRAPDLWVEVDLSSPSVAREPIYARLGVPEIWRCKEKTIQVRLLAASQTYVDSPTSRAFPFLPMNEFYEWVGRMRREDQTAVVREFLTWLASLRG